MDSSKTKSKANENKNASATKSGPGRFHVQGHTKASPRKTEGTPFGFTAHHATPAKKARRQLVGLMGRRQALKLVKTQRRDARRDSAAALSA